MMVVFCYKLHIPVVTLNAIQKNVYEKTGLENFFEGNCIGLGALGEKCLRILDGMLKPTCLSSLGKVDLEELLMLIFGTIFCVRYAKPALVLPTFPKASSNIKVYPRCHE